MIQLKTKRLRIVPLTTEQLGEYIKKPQADEHMAQALNEMYNGCVEHPKDWLWYTNWLIYLNSDNTPIGSLGFKGCPVNGAVEIGYGIDEPYQNQGYATEAVKAMLAWAFGHQGVYFVTAETEKDNAASIQVLKKNGFAPAGEGKEGPLWELEKPVTSCMAIYMCLGFSVGLSFGAAFKNIGVGFSIGMCIGLALGAAIDAQDRATRERLKKERQ
ncbi:Protein N-acetyltransferase, RimJ/RimL family [Acetanaerobacterium elongatum]|uniref:Protein N-acetyltransferase, RimJ/RimL family n=2 Tax=Acetanaerobacterium elongatum TaxID=258515 RepID=A0A1H0E240_9FIRM|nr:Protein N-acetyltransferase, RimJ/RimL family [Acetanaerobacterium elongatum]